MDQIAAKMGKIGVADKSLIWNTDLIEALELENLMGQALVSIRSAEQRQESRGAHAHEDWPERDDEKWMKHTVMWLDEQNESKLDYRNVVMTTLSNDIAPIPPAPRVYEVRTRKKSWPSFDCLKIHGSPMAPPIRHWLMPQR